MILAPITLHIDGPLDFVALGVDSWAAIVGPAVLSTAVAYVLYFKILEAAALYAFARARDKPVICFAHVTNQMGQIEGDFEKGQAKGTTDALAILVNTARRLLRIG